MFKSRSAKHGMIEDCEAGKIDYIITKAISRFARNTMECLQYVRRLKEMGVYVYFDEDHIDTGSTTSEMLLSILAAVAQEESYSISENIKWGVRKRFQAGKSRWTRLYGYSKDENSEYQINEEQAKGVRRIFELYISGASLPQIARTLEKENIPADNSGKWWPTTLTKVLRNERYIGDVAMQKCYIVDHLSHKEVKNDHTIVPSYYVKDHHDAIVDRKTFDLAQRILQLKDLHQGCVQYPYSGFLVCPYCGEKMFRFSLDEYGHQHMWTCACKDKRQNCPPFAILEKYINRIVKDAYEALDERELRRIASTENENSEAANAHLNWREKYPSLKSIEYIFLDALVERITFNNWNEAVVSWKFGTESLVPVQYDRPVDIPYVELVQTQNCVMINGEVVRYGNKVARRVEYIRACCEKARARYEKPDEDMDEEPDEEPYIEIDEEPNVEEIIRNQ